jgi:ribonuclease HI
MEIANLSLNDNSEENTQHTQHNFYTGSSCINAGSPNTKAAICICFNENSTDTITELLDDSLSTNQKAELYAIYRALLCITDEISINVISRSEYAVKSINVWSNKWKQNNWKNIPSGTSDNKSIVKSIIEVMEDLVDNGKIINIIHYKTVRNKEGNNIAHNTARDSLLKDI